MVAKKNNGAGKNDSMVIVNDDRNHVIRMPKSPRKASAKKRKK